MIGFVFGMVLLSIVGYRFLLPRGLNFPGVAESSLRDTAAYTWSHFGTPAFAVAELRLPSGA